jgi:hypothetical protein
VNRGALDSRQWGPERAALPGGNPGLRVSLLHGADEDIAQKGKTEKGIAVGAYRQDDDKQGGQHDVEAREDIGNDDIGEATYFLVLEKYLSSYYFT